MPHPATKVFLTQGPLTVPNTVARSLVSRLGTPVTRGGRPSPLAPGLQNRPTDRHSMSVLWLMTLPPLGCLQFSMALPLKTSLRPLLTGATALGPSLILQTGETPE